MILKNYDSIMVARQITQINDGVISDAALKVLGWNPYTYGVGNYAKYRPFELFVNYNSGGINDNKVANGCSNLIIGKGDTPATYNDREMASPFTSTDVTNISHTTSHSIDADNNQVITTYNKVFSALSDITIKEIGVYTSNYSASSTYQNILVYREVLETPIEVPMGANVVITFERRISMNPNKPTEVTTTASVE